MGWDTFKAPLWVLATQPGSGPGGVARLPEGRLHQRGGPARARTLGWLVEGPHGGGL